MISPTRIQLIATGEPPEWWTRLQKMDESNCEWSTGADFDPQAAIFLIPRRQLPELCKEELSTSKSYIVVDDAWSAQHLKRVLTFTKGALFLDASQSPEEMQKVITLTLARHREKENHSRMMQMMRFQNRQIDELNVSLERVVRERTLNEADLRRASQRNISHMRAIIGFIKELSQLLDIADLLPLIRRHVKGYHSLEAPLLFIPSGEGLGEIYYMRGSRTIQSRVRGAWEPSPRIRVNEPEDSRFLANALGRPFVKVIRFPLITARHQKDPSRAPLLFFEHNLGVPDLDPLVVALSEKLQPVSWALDRLVLEQELKRASQDWEMTFDELAEPIAILDHDGRILRANSHWREEFKDVLLRPAAHRRVGDQLYAVEKYPIRMNADETPLSWVVYLRNETRSQKLKSQAVQVEKMSAIGHLAGHIAHELNNPLTGIRSLSQVLLTDLAPENQVHKDLEEVERASARCQGIINNLLEFSRGGWNEQVEIIDLNEVVNKTLPLLKSATGRFRRDIELNVEPLPVKMEPHLMQQVIFNLVNNACQAMNEKGTIEIRTFAQSRDAVLEVTDTGAGITPEVREHIFEAFFTTKAEGEGTGLGLSLSRDFVRQFGGELECESIVGRGSTFRVRLPLENTGESTHS